MISYLYCMKYLNLEEGGCETEIDIFHLILSLPGAEITTDYHIIPSFHQRVQSSSASHE